MHVSQVSLGGFAACALLTIMKDSDLGRHSTHSINEGEGCNAHGDAGPGCPFPFRGRGAHRWLGALLSTPSVDTGGVARGRGVLPPVSFGGLGARSAGKGVPGQ